MQLVAAPTETATLQDMEKKNNGRVRARIFGQGHHKILPVKKKVKKAAFGYAFNEDLDSGSKS